MQASGGARFGRVWTGLWILLAVCFSGPLAGADAEVERVLETARKLVQSKDYAGAITYLKNAREKTGSPKVFLELAEVHLLARETEEAIAALVDTLSAVERKEREGGELDAQDKEVLQRANQQLDRLVKGAQELHEVSAEIVKKWLKYAEKMLREKSPRLALQALDMIDKIDPGNKEAQTLREDPRLAIQSILQSAVLLLSFDRESAAAKGRKTVARDKSGKGNDAAIRGARAEPGIAGDCLRFEGADDSVQSAVPPRGFPEKGSPWTACVWIQAKAGGGSFFHCGSAGKSASISLWLNEGGQVVMGAGGKDEMAGKTGLADGAWHHVAAVFEGRETRAAKLYLDGRADAAGSIGIPPDWAAPAAFRLGGTALAPGPAPELAFTGLLDEVALFKRALSEKEILFLHARGKSGKGLPD